jgi:hypothetical protein
LHRDDRPADRSLAQKPAEAFETTAMLRTDGHLGNNLPSDELDPIVLGENPEPDHLLIVVDRVFSNGHERLQIPADARSVSVAKARCILLVDTSEDEIKCVDNRQGERVPLANFIVG